MSRTDGGIYDVEVDPHAPNNPHAFAIQLVGEGRRVLEVGCGAGHVTKHLVAAGNDVVGIEYDEDAATVARSRGFDVRVADLDIDAVADIVDGPFEVALLGDVLEHFRDPYQTLLGVIGVLASDGELVISVPNLAHADVRLMLLDGRVDYADDGLLDRTHLRWFNRAGLRQLLTDVGFAAVQLERVGRPLGHAGLGIDPSDYDDATISHVLADPDHDTFQFVVRCTRSDDIANSSDVLHPENILRTEPRRFAEIDQIAASLAEENDHLRAQVAAFERSKAVRLARAARSVPAKARSWADRKRDR